MKKFIAIFMSLMMSVQSFATELASPAVEKSSKHDLSQFDEIVKVTQELEAIKKGLNQARDQQKTHKTIFYISTAAAVISGLVTIATIRDAGRYFWVDEALFHIVGTAGLVGVSGYQYYKVQISNEKIAEMEALIGAKLAELNAARRLVESIPTADRIEKILTEISAIEAQILEAEASQLSDNQPRSKATVFALSLVGLLIVYKSLSIARGSTGEGAGGVTFFALLGGAAGVSVIGTVILAGRTLRLSNKEVKLLKEKLSDRKSELEATKKLLESLN